MPAASTWTPECLQRAVDEVRALSCMFGDGASPAEDPTDVSHHEPLLELAESALDAAKAGAARSTRGGATDVEKATDDVATGTGSTGRSYRAAMDSSMDVARSCSSRIARAA